MVRRAGRSCLVVAALAAGCGGGTPKVEQAFPDASDDDTALLKDEAPRLSRVFADDVAAVSAVRRQDAAALDAAARRLGSDGQELLIASGRLDSRRLGDIFDAYGHGVRRVALDYERIVRAAVAHDGAAVKRVLPELAADKKAVQAVDRRFIGAVRPVLGGDAKKRLDEQLEQMDRRYEEAAGG